MTNEIISGLLGVLIGGFIGHRLALGRDIRKEYNAAILPVRLSLMKAIEDMERKQVWNCFSQNDIDAVKNILSDSKRSKLDGLLKKYWEAYKNAHKPDGAGGQEIIESNIEPVVFAAKSIRKFIKPK